MRLLALDTGLENCAVAVADGERAPVILTEIVGRGHSERLFVLIRKAMADAGLGFADLDRIAVTTGPGSFTGLRIGIAAARGLALVTGSPAIGIGTLAVHAESARTRVGAKPVLALLDAGRGELYGQAFAADGSPLGPAEAAPAERFAMAVGPDTVLAGSGADAVAALAGVPASRVAHRDSAPDIAALLRLAGVAPSGGAPPKPLYLRAPDARPQASFAIMRR